MRLLTICAAALAFMPGMAFAYDYEYEEQRELSIDASGLGELRIDAGAGSLEVTGRPGATSIDVDALVQVDGAKGDEAREFIEKRMRLELDQKGDRAVLVADFQNNMSSKSGAIRLEVTVPEGIDIDVDDGSGSITIRRTMGSVVIDDGSGSITVSDAADVELDDGSGSIDVADASGTVRINDGSGSIKVRRVGGDVFVDDGSGSITVRDVQGNFTVIDDGSGSISHNNVMGSVDVPED